MKKFLAIIALIFIAHLYIGYYTSQDVEDERTVFFIKKYPTLQMKFNNIYTKDSDDKSLAELSAEEMGIVRNYCKYRLGIETWLQSQEELEACKPR